MNYPIRPRPSQPPHGGPATGPGALQTLVLEQQLGELRFPREEIGVGGIELGLDRGQGLRLEDHGWHFQPCGNIRQSFPYCRAGFPDPRSKDMARNSKPSSASRSTGSRERLEDEVLYDWIRKAQVEERDFAFERVVKAAIAYDAETRRDDPAHRGRMSQRFSALWKAIEYACEALNPGPATEKDLDHARWMIEWEKNAGRE